MGRRDTIAALAPGVRGPLIAAMAESITGVFLFAVPVVLVAFALSLALPEVPLRTTSHVGGAVAEAVPGRVSPARARTIRRR